MSSFQSASYQANADARFAKAKRHSGRVRLMRKAVPAAVVAALATIVIASVFNPFRILSKLPVDIAGLAIQGTKITMESPHLSGFTSDQRPYELWAKTATQDVTNPNNVELHELRAKVQMEDKTGVTMDARNGLFDSKAQLLDLKDDIFLQSTTGYEARLTQAFVDLGAGNVSSDEPVAVKLLNGTLDAKRLRITEGGALVRFEGDVKMILIPDGATNADGTGVSAAPPKDQAADRAVPAQDAVSR
ncbi:MAG: LPS export ABC transporter periplasmic protein LptC [Afipia sp.]|nr:LPS export ABC transporter periplasmic protein LptC [Afipia sp.]